MHDRTVLTGQREAQKRVSSAQRKAGVGSTVVQNIMKKRKVGTTGTATGDSVSGWEDEAGPRGFGGCCPPHQGTHALIWSLSQSAAFSSPLRRVPPPPPGFTPSRRSFSSSGAGTSSYSRLPDPDPNPALCPASIQCVFVNVK